MRARLHGLALGIASLGPLAARAATSAEPIRFARYPAINNDDTIASALSTSCPSMVHCRCPAMD